MMMKYKKEILHKTEDVLETLTDLILVLIFFGVEFGKRPTLTASARGLAYLDDINYQAIKKTIENLASRGLVKRKDGALFLTKTGTEKLDKVMLLDPKQAQRKQGEVFLIIYDISDKEIAARNRLRRFLLMKKAAKVQESVYLSPFNLREELESFLKGQKVSGQILVTKLGKDSVIGGEGIKGFLWRIYGLKEIERGYEEYVAKFGRNGQAGGVFAFNKIYKKDPGLPADFLPKNWIGWQAKEIYQKTLNLLSCR